MTSCRDGFGDLPRDHAEAIARAGDAEAAGRRGLTTCVPPEAARAAFVPGVGQPRSNSNGLPAPGRPAPTDTSEPPG